MDNSERGIRVSVVIPCYNSESTISDQLEALCNQTYQREWELIIADNGSVDATLQIVAKYRDERIPNLKIIDASDAKGAGHARNRGVEYAVGEYILYCDADDVVDERWMEEMVKALGRYDLAAPKFEHFRISDKRFAKLRSDFQTNGLVNCSFHPPLKHAGTSGLGVRKAVHEIIGGFDESFLRAQDWDYCWKAQLAGFNLEFIPTAIVHIRNCSTLSKYIKQSFSWGTYYALIVKKYKPYGIDPPTLDEVILKWKRLIINFPTKIWKQAYRDRLLGELFHTLGKIKGSIKFKTFVI